MSEQYQRDVAVTGVRRVSEFEWGDHDGARIVREVCAAADAVDRVVNLNEEATLHLKHHGLRDADLWVGHDGFALRIGDNVDVVVAPDSRRAGLGTTLAVAALAETSSPVHAWSHADHPGAAALAKRLSFSRARELCVMEMPLGEVPDPVEVPGVRVRAYTPADLDAILEVNAHAFAHHPEQGQMSRADFEARTHEEWFDPAGLLVAVDETGPVGFHWTKVHPGRSGGGAAEGYGEVYVVAVSPRAAGRGIGKLITAAGLRHLAAQGLDSVILDVEGDNAPALAVYRSLGFEIVRAEVQYAR